MRKAGPRYHKNRRPSGHPRQGTFQGAFFRFEPDFPLVGFDFNYANQLAQLYLVRL